MDGAQLARELERKRQSLPASDRPVARPDGYIPLCIAENKVVADLLLPKMFMQQLARFTGRAFLGRAPRPDQAAGPAGGDVAAGAVLGAVLTSLDAGTAVVKNPARMR